MTYGRIKLTSFFLVNICFLKNKILSYKHLRMYTQFAESKINAESKLYLFRNDANTRTISNYLTSLHGRNRRQAIANLRLGTPDIELEKGRHAGLERVSRACKICHTQKVETEEHFIFTCPALVSTRKPFIDKISRINLNFSSMSISQKVIYLFFNNEVKTNTLSIAADMLLALKDRRDFLISFNNCLLKMNQQKRLE